MNTIKSTAQKLALAILVAACCIAVSGCVYDVPITPKATHKIDARLLGNWNSKDGKSRLKVVKLDNYNYIVSCNGDLYRVWHSDVATLPLLTVQILDSAKPQYSYCAWRLSEDGTLYGRSVSDKVIPDDTKKSASVQKLLKKNLQNPALFDDETPYTKDK